MQPIRPASTEFSLPSTEPRPSSWARNVLEWSLLGLAVVGFVVVYMAVLYASPRIFVAGLALSGIIAAISMWLHIFHKTPAEAAAAANPEIENRFDWPKVFRKRCHGLLAFLRSTFK